MNSFYFGAHVSIQNGYINAVNEINKYDGNFIQIFLTSPRSTKMKKRTDDEYIQFNKYLKKNNSKAVVHSSYLFNIGRNWEPSSWWIQGILNELENAEKFNAYGLVIHFGKALDLPQEKVYNNMFTSIVHILNETKNLSIPIFMEMTAGQGTETGYDLDGVAKLFSKFDKIKNKKLRNRIGICFDSCHAFASGINLKSKLHVKLFFEHFNQKINIKNLRLIHLNDSKVELGEKKDRHENIGKGKIGLNGIKHIFKFARKYKIPTILETPNYGYITEIKLLKSF